MKQYLDLVNKVLTTGELRSDRTGVGTISLFGEQVKFDLREGFPATTVKKLAFKQVAGELAGFLRGYDNLEQFHELGVHIWDANAKADYWKPSISGDLGRIYGVQWRQWEGHLDQLGALQKSLKDNAKSRRHLVITYNPAELDQMALPPCHYAFQCYVSDNGKWLDLVVVMRSVDLFLGMPFDVASYALLMHLLCQGTTMQPRSLVFQLGDAHIYNNHITQVQEMLARPPGKLPSLLLLPFASIDNFHPDMVLLKDYYPLAAIPAPMAV